MGRNDIPSCRFALSPRHLSFKNLIKLMEIVHFVIYITLNQNLVIFTQLKLAFSNSQQFYQLN